jgi:hypothetical protein
LKNVLANPAIGLSFVIPGIEEALGVNGTARLTRGRSLRDTMAVTAKRLSSRSW